MLGDLLLYNARNDLIDLQDADFFGAEPEGLGVAFDNDYIQTNTHSLLIDRKLKQEQFEVEFYFGERSAKPFENYHTFVQFLNHPPYRLNYETPSGIWNRECVLNTLTKTRLRDQVLQETFILDYLTPWYQLTTEKTIVIPKVDGIGKIYINTKPRERKVFTDVPLNGYKAGDIWHYREGQDWVGRNLLLNSNFKSPLSPWAWGSGTTASIDKKEDFEEKASVKFTQTQESTNGVNTRFMQWTIRNPSGTGAYVAPAMSLVYVKADKPVRVGLRNGDYVRWANIETNWIRISSNQVGNKFLIFAEEPCTLWITQPYFINSEVILAHQPAPEDLLPQDATEGYFIAGRDSESFDFNDWAYYGDAVSIPQLTYDEKVYDYVYGSKVEANKKNSSSYVYDYIYESEDNQNNGVFVVENNSIYIGSEKYSPVEIEIRGPATNPYWDVMQGSKIIQSDGYFVDIPENYTLKVSSSPQTQRAVLVAPDGTTSNVYQQQDLSRSNFVTLPTGKSKLIFYNCEEIKFNYRTERVVV